MLALGVIVVGLVSVLALFPIGANANRDAAAGNYSSQSAEQMLNIMANYMTSSSANWKQIIGTATSQDPDQEIQKCTTQGEWSTCLSNDWDPTSRTLDDYDKTSALDVTGSGLIKAPNSVKTFNQGLLIKSEHERDTTASPPEMMTDFQAIAVFWRENVEISGHTIPDNYATALNMEVSWPAELPYARRQKARYRLEVFNPNAN
jgi:hypothetical protein